MIEVNFNIKLEASPELLTFLQKIMAQTGLQASVDVPAPLQLPPDEEPTVLAHQENPELLNVGVVADKPGDVAGDETIVMPPEEFFHINPDSPWNYRRLLAGYMMKTEGRDQTEIFQALSLMHGAPIASAQATGVRMVKLKRQILDYVAKITSVSPQPCLPTVVEIAPVVKAALPIEAINPGSVSPKIVWTDARKLSLAKLRQSGARWDAIWKELNAMPGPAIASCDAVKVQHMTMAKNGVIPRLLLETTPPADKKWDGATFDVVSHARARQWAGQRGLVTQVEKLNIDKVNAKRVELGLAPFIVAPAAGSRA